jgi:hypothetical protein
MFQNNISGFKINEQYVKDTIRLEEKTISAAKEICQIANGLTVKKFTDAISLGLSFASSEFTLSSQIVPSTEQ